MATTINGSISYRMLDGLRRVIAAGAVAPAKLRENRSEGHFERHRNSGPEAGISVEMSEIKDII
ncbi:hypothetical protein CRG98_041441 [Punica granatum]|uniref:Uncharacterized protein n=1 Tax=Punica granatum TaxID=22663 RepID=A0A2I0I2J0_PUNGR|nr:hypothetical protein CRG98_041441 [Punica granatum]